LLWNWSTLWHEDLKSVAEFSHLYEKRCLAKIRVARFGKGFVIVQALIAAPWLTWGLPSRRHLRCQVRRGHAIADPLDHRILGFVFTEPAFRVTGACLWFDKDAHEAARFYVVNFPDSKVTAVHEAPGDYPGGKKGSLC
jgi:hypothetical protein